MPKEKEISFPASVRSSKVDYACTNQRDQKIISSNLVAITAVHSTYVLRAGASRELEELNRSLKSFSV